METNLFVTILVKLCFGLLLSFLAILFWSRNRDIAWTFIITGALTLYLSTVFSILFSLGVLVPEYFTIAGFKLYDAFSTFISALPLFLFSVGFLVMLRRK